VAELAERGTRLLAATFDDLILLGISLPMVFGSIPGIVAIIEASMHSANNDSLDLGLESLPTAQLLQALLFGPGALITLVGLIAWCVITAWLVATNGQSIGKRLVGIKVVRKDGSRASFARIFFLRNVVNGLPPLLLPYVGLLYQLIDPLLIYQESRQCLHDRIADTIVVRCR
jgi:uncharacterized RDD family membrane protein YckC